MSDTSSEVAATPASGVLLPGFVGTELPEWLAARLRRGLAGVCLFGENIVDPAQTRALTDSIRAANPDAIIAIDEEGGDVTRVYFGTGSPFPGNAVLGRIDDLELTAAVGHTVARLLASVGVNLNFAPDVDVNSNPDNPVIGVRSFGDRSDLVAAHTRAWVTAHEAQGVAVSAKHFPGHGDTAQDSHLALPVVDASREVLAARELPPFAAAISAGARTVMTSHIVLSQLDPSTPATFSRPILEGLLRGSLGFDGVIVSDALDMAGASGAIGIPAAAVRALSAGVDLLCIGTRNTDEQLTEIEAQIGRAVASGELSDDRLIEAAERVFRLGRAVSETVPYGAPDAEPVAIAGLDLQRIIAAFDARAGVRAPGHPLVIVAEPEPNQAIGVAPWGLVAAGSAAVVVHEGDALPEGEQPVVLVGRDNHRVGWIRELADAARARHPDSIVIDMGWPSTDRAYADVATFGASRVVGQALAHWLEGGAS